jgi:hypothetical protein
MDGIGAAASFIQIIDTSLIALKYLNEVRASSKDRAALVREASSLRLLLDELKSTIKEAERRSDDLSAKTRSLGIQNGPLGQAKNALEELTTQLTPDPSNSSSNRKIREIWRKFAWPMKKRSCIELVSQIERMKTSVALALQQDLLYVCVSYWVSSAN